MPPNHPQDFSSDRRDKPRDLQYIQRPADAELLNHCLNARPTYILQAPQMGKSSLMAHTAEQLNANTHQAVFIDLSGFPLSQREEDWFYNIVRILDDHLDISTDALAWWSKPSVFALPPYIRLTKLLTDVILPEMTTHLVLFIDEIERTVALPFRDHFFEWLTSLYESRATNSILYHLSFVLSGVANRSQLIPEGGPLLFQWSHRVVLSDFTPDETLALAEGLSFQKDDTNEIAEWVYQWTNGHPYLTQLLFELIEEQNRTIWLEKEVNECIQGFIGSPECLREPHFQNIRTALTEPDSNGTNLLGAYLNLLKGKTENLKTNQAALEQLRLIGILRENDEENGQEIVIRNPLYQEIFPLSWVKRHLFPQGSETPSSTAPSKPWSLTPFQSGLIAASIFLLGAGILLWFFSRPVWQPVVSTEKNGASESMETTAISTESSGRQSLSPSPDELKRSQEKIQELEATIVRYQNLSTGKAQGLKDQRTQLETQLAAKEEALSSLQNQVQTLKVELKDQQLAQVQTIDKLQAERNQIEAKSTIAATDLKTALEEVKTLQKAVLKKSSLSDSEINSLMSDSAKLNAQLNTANAELGLADDRTRELESLLAQQKQLIENESQLREEDRANLDAKIQELETTITDTRQTLSAAETTAKEQATLAQTELNRLQQDRASLEAKIQSLESDIADTRQTLASTETTAQEQAQLFQTDLSHLQEDRTKYQELLADSQQELSSLKTQTVNLKDTLDQKNQSLEKEQEEREGLKTQLTKVQQELNSATTQVASLQDQLSAAGTQVAQTKNTLQAIHASSSEQANRTKEQATEFALVRATLSAQILESQAALTAAQAQISELGKKSAKLTETEGTLKNTTEERDRYSQKLQNTQQQLGKVKDQVQNLEQSLQTISKENIVKFVSRITAKLTQSPSPIQSKTAKLLWARQAYQLNLQTQGTQWSAIDRSLRDGLHASPIRLKGVSGKIHTLTFDPSGDHVIAGTSSGKMLVWSRNDPLKSPKILTGHTASVVSTAVSPDGNRIASGSLDSTIRLWDLSEPNNSPRVLQAHKKGVTSLAFRPDGKELASGSQDHTIRLWDLTDQQLQHMTLGNHSGRVNAIAYTPDGASLISGGDDLALRIWDLQRTNSPPKILKGHRQSISTIAIHPFGWMIATGSRDQKIGLWNLRESLIVPTFLSGSKGRISHVQFSSDGTSLASVSSDKSLRIWNWQQPTQPPIQFPAHNSLEAMAISPDGRTIAVGGSGQNVMLWSGTGQLAHTVCDMAKENLSFVEWKQIAGEGTPYERTCPNLPLHPTFLEEGKKLAREGDHKQAQAIFERAKQLDPYLELDPKIELKKLSTQSS